MLTFKDDQILLFSVLPKHHEWRLDQILAERGQGPSRHFFQKHIDKGRVGLISENFTEDLKVFDGEAQEQYLKMALRKGEISFQILQKRREKIPVGSWIVVFLEEEPAFLEPCAMELDIVWQDEHILVLNKPPGLLVHPGHGQKDATLVQGLLAAFASDLSSLSHHRPGIVHRLDQGTSGLMVVAKHNEAHHRLAEQFAQRRVKKRYWAFVQGEPSPSFGRLNHWIGRDPSHPFRRKIIDTDSNVLWKPSEGKEAANPRDPIHPLWGPRVKYAALFYKIRQTKKNQRKISWLDCHLYTGRTHQIRVQLAFQGYPLVGDTLYGSSMETFEKNRLGLQAYYLGFFHPLHQDWREFQIDLAEDLQNFWNKEDF